MISFYISLALGLPCSLLLAFYNPLIFMNNGRHFQDFHEKITSIQKIVHTYK